MIPARYTRRRSTSESHVSALLKLDASDRQALAAIADQARTGRLAGLPASRTTFVGRSTYRAAILAAPGGVGEQRVSRCTHRYTVT